MNPKLKIGILAAAALVLIAAFVFIDLPHTWHYALPRRLKKIAAFILTGGSIAFATVIFQTVTNNKILTPGIIGLDSLYMLIQTTIIFAFGSVPFHFDQQRIELFAVGGADGAVRRNAIQINFPQRWTRDLCTFADWSGVRHAV